MSSPSPLDLVPGDKIGRAEALKIYLEVYHLALDANGMSHFTIDFQVYRREGRKNKRKEMVSQTFSFNASGRTSKETLGIDVSRLKPGLYELVAEVMDTISSQRKKREIVFQILE